MAVEAAIGSGHLAQQRAARHAGGVLGRLGGYGRNPNHGWRAIRVTLKREQFRRLKTTDFTDHQNIVRGKTLSPEYKRLDGYVGKMCGCVASLDGKGLILREEVRSLLTVYMGMDSQQVCPWSSISNVKCLYVSLEL